MENLLIRRNALIREAISNPFTLVELLVVVSIIAVIGSGVALTYQGLDDHAKTAMEMADIAALKKSVKHWSAVNDYKLLDGFDSLVDDNGDLYTQMTMGDNPPFPQTPSSDGYGIAGPIGYGTLEVATAPDVVLANLATGGMTTTYTHLRGSGTANDSTFETGAMGGSVDTSKTKTTLAIGGSDTMDHAQLIVDADDSAFDYDSDGNGTPSEVTDDDFIVDGVNFNAPADLVAEQAVQQAILDSPVTDKLAFIFPGGGTQAMGQPAGMNLTNEIISNAGLTEAEVEDPNNAVPTKKYYLVAMGFGRFVSIHKGKSIRSDSPITGKRNAISQNAYSRYIAIIKVPSAEYSTMSGSSEAPVLVDVLSPQGYSVAALQDKFQDDKDKIQD